MKKLSLMLILVLSISLVTLNAFAGNLDPNAPPGPTMHSLNEIYELIESRTVPKYEYKYFEEIVAAPQPVTIHNGSGLIGNWISHERV